MRRYMAVLMIVCLNVSLWSQNTIFNQRKQLYLDKQEQGLRISAEGVWAWLENIKTKRMDPNTLVWDGAYQKSRPAKDVIHSIIQNWGTLWAGTESQPYPPYEHAWRWATWSGNVLLFWIYRQYGDVISNEDYNFLETLYRGNAQSKDFVDQRQPNNAICDIVSRYLYAQLDKNLEVLYSKNASEFSWEGRSYKLGQTYNSYQLTRDWIYYAMDRWVRYGNNEFDSPDYTFVLINGFLSLYQFSLDEEMRNRAKMMIDFIFLESILDYSGSQWGGSVGRTYTSRIVDGKSRDYQFAFWDILYPSSEPPLDIFVSNYRLPDLIWDIGDLSDEDDNYYHMDMEYNASICYTTDTGKWNYVTKFYSLGGQCDGSWQLCINSNDKPSGNNRPGVPFRIWLNNLAEGMDETNPVPYQSFTAIGQKGHQYKNALFATGGFYFHYAIGQNQFDKYEAIGDYHFVQEGRTMVAICHRIASNAGALEVAIEGIDYPTYEDFKATVLNKCILDKYRFVNTHGDWISAQKAPEGYYEPNVQRAGTSEYKPVYSFPFKRLECIDNHNRYIVRWKDNVMTVRRHGNQLVYDFETWTVIQSTYEEDLVPPAVPTITDIKPGKN